MLLQASGRSQALRNLLKAEQEPEVDQRVSRPWAWDLG
jgi:hypothetical protein